MLVDIEFRNCIFAKIKPFGSVTIFFLNCNDWLNRQNASCNITNILQEFTVLNVYSSLSLVPPGDAKPDWRELNVRVIPKYAAHWEALGAILGLKDYEIAVISKDYANRSTEGCTAMLRKWLQSVEQPTWGKLDDAVQLLTGRLYQNIAVSIFTHEHTLLYAKFHNVYIGESI